MQLKLLDELRHLAKGRGLQGGDLKSRVGELLAASLRIDLNDSEMEVRINLAKEVTALSTSLPDDLRQAIEALFGMGDYGSHRRLSDREHAFAERNSCSARTARRRMSQAMQVLSEIALIRTVPLDPQELTTDSRNATPTTTSAPAKLPASNDSSDSNGSTRGADLIGRDGLPVAFGERLRYLRQCSDMSLGRMAELVNYSKGHLSNVEGGAKQPSLDLARRLEEALNLNGELLGILPSRATVSPLPEESASALAHLWSLRMASDGHIEFHSRESTDDGVVTWSTGVPLAGDDSIDSLPLLADLLGSIRRMGQAFPPATVIQLLVPPANALRLMAARSSGPERDTALRLAALFVEYIGWMAQESGDDAAALWWTDQAVALAEAGGDGEMRNYALVRRAEIALYQEDFRSVIQYARMAQTATSSYRIRELAMQRDAQGHAMGGLESEALATLERAATLESGHDLDPSRSTLGSHIPNTLPSVTGWVLHDLGRWPRAIEILEHEYSQVPEEVHRVRVRYGARLALAFASQNELDQACALAEPVLAAVTRVDSATARSDLKLLYRELNRRRNDPYVRRILPAFANALRSNRIHGRYESQ